MNETMKNEIEKLYSCIDELMEEYSEELPETRAAEEKVADCIQNNVGNHEKEMEIADACQDLASQMEKQGFLFGFQYAARLLTGELCDEQREDA